MPNLEEQYENLYEFIKNFEILIQKNIFNDQNTEKTRHFGNEMMALCKSKAFNISRLIQRTINSNTRCFKTLLDIPS